QYSAAVDPPPDDYFPVDPNGPPATESYQPFGKTAKEGLDRDTQASFIEFRTWQFPIKPGYIFHPVELVVHWMGFIGYDSWFALITEETMEKTKAQPDPTSADAFPGQYRSNLKHLDGASETVTIAFQHRYIHLMIMMLYYRLRLSDAAWSKWQA